MDELKKSSYLTYFSLFTSFGTLICCALPALLVTLGMGAALAGLTSAVPQLVWFSENKPVVFSVAGLMILISGISIYRAQNLPCPIDPVLRDACIKGRKYSWMTFLIALGIYLTGAFFAFLAPWLMN